MKAQTLVQTLLDSGLSQPKLVEALADKGVSVNQSTISRIKDGKQQPHFELGLALMELVKRRKKSRKI